MTIAHGKSACGLGAAVQGDKPLTEDSAFAERAGGAKPPRGKYLAAAWRNKKLTVEQVRRWTGHTDEPQPEPGKKRRLSKKTVWEYLRSENGPPSRHLVAVPASVFEDKEEW